MNLWPFSKKSDPTPSQKPGKPGKLNSRKMELPPGVMLADPSELDLPTGHTKPAGPGQADPHGHESPAEKPPMPAPEAPQPSFEDLSHIPAAETPLPQLAEPVVLENKTDLTGFFEQNQLQMVSPGAVTDHKPPLPTESQDTLIPNWLNDLAPQAAPPPPPGFEQKSSEEALSPQVFDLAPPDQGLTGLFSAASTSTENLESLESNVPPIDLLSDFMTEPKAVSSESTHTPTPMAFEESAPLFNPTFCEPEPTPLPQHSQASQTEFSPDSFFMYPTGQDEMFQQENCFHIEPVEPEAPAGQTAFSDFTMPEAAFFPETPEANDFQTEIEDAFLQEAHTELPPQLHLPDEALAPNGRESFFEEAGLQPLPEKIYLGDDLNDEPFDLDSLLLANTPAKPEDLAGFPLSIDEVASKPDSEPSLDDAIHYFGDEAEGLKGVDNLESYDFGHYEDPDQPTEAFVLDEGAVPFTESVSYENYYTDSQSDLSFGALQMESGEPEPSENLPDLEDSDAIGFDFQPEAEESRQPDQSYAHGQSLPTEAQFLQSLLHQAIPHDETQSLATTGNNATVIQQAEEVPEAPPEPQPVLSEPARQPETIKQKPRSKQAFQPKPYTESLADRLGSFEQEVLLKNSQFLSQSIDHLVNSYFSGQDQEAS